MGLLEAITLIFIVLKLTMYPEWSWLFVFSPFLFSIVLYTLLYLCMVFGLVKIGKKKRRYSRSNKK